MDFISENEWKKRKQIIDKINTYLNMLKRKANLKIFKNEQEIEELENKIRELIKLKYGKLIEIKLEFKNFNEIKIKKFHVVNDSEI